MWIVKVALSRPYTFVVLALLIFILSPLIIMRTPTDIFPNIDIPVIAVAWQFTGLNPQEMEGRFTTSRRRTWRRPTPRSRPSPRRSYAPCPPARSPR